MFHGITEKLLGMADAFPCRVCAESFGFGGPNVGVFFGFGFQVAFKVPGIAHGNAGE